MVDELTKALLVEEVVTPSAVAEALFASVTGGVPLVQALVDAGAATPDMLARYLARSEAPFLRQVQPLVEVVDRLPPGLCARLFAVPVRRDAITGTIDVAVADPNDPHPAAEIAFHLDAPVRVVRATIAGIDEALRRIRVRSRSLAPPRISEAPPPTVRDDDDRLYDSRRRITGIPGRKTFPPPMADRAPISLPVVRSSMQGPVSAATRRKTPPWGTPVHASGGEGDSGEAPRSGLGSEIPIPLTRRTFAVERGGTQRPPPPPVLGPQHAQLGEGIPVDAGAIRTIVEVARGDTAVSPGAPRVPTFAHHEGGGDRYGGALPAPAPTTTGAGIGSFSAFEPRGFVDVGSVLAAIRGAQTRDEVLELVLTGGRMLALKVAVFVVKRGGYVGWTCTPELGDRAALQGVVVPLDRPSVFEAAAREGLYLGPVRQDDVHAALLGAMRGASRDVAVVPIRVSGKTAAVVLADELTDTMLATRRLEEIARTAGDAFARILRSRR